MVNAILQFVHKDLFLVLLQGSLDIDNVLIIDLILLPLLLHYNLSKLEEIRSIRGDYLNYQIDSLTIVNARHWLVSLRPIISFLTVLMASLRKS